MARWEGCLAGAARGNPLLEAILDRGRAYTSGPQWLAENVLRDKWVLAVAGTHGKTTTTSLLTTEMLQAGLDPSYAIGGQLLAESLGGHVERYNPGP